MSLQGSGDMVPPPAYQAAVQDSRYGFRLTESENQVGGDAAHFDGLAVLPSCTGSVAPTSFEGSATPTSRYVAPTSHGGVAPTRGGVAPTSRGGSVAPISRGGSVAPISHGGSVAPISCGGSVVPISRRGSVVPISRGSSVVPSSHGGSVAPISHGSSVAPMSHRGSTIPRGGSATSLGGSIPPSSHGGSVPTSRSASIGVVSGSHNVSSTGTGAMHNYSSDLQQHISQDSSLYPGYNSDEEESQLPDSYYLEHCQIGYLPESAPSIHQDSNVSFQVLLFSLFRMKFDRTSTSMRYLPMRKIEQPSSSFEVAGIQVGLIRPHARTNLVL